MTETEGYFDEAIGHCQPARLWRAHGLRFRSFGKFVADQSCIDAGVGPAPRVTERQTVSVRDALTFTISTRGPGTTYRFCPVYMLPKGVL